LIILAPEGISTDIKSKNVFVFFPEMAKYIPEGGLDPSTFHDVMDAANIKYYLAKVLTVKICF
jgi:hypothetical protein